MIRFEPYLPEHSERIVAIWNESFGGDFPLDLRLWEQNVDNCDRTDWGGTYAAFDDDKMVGFVVAKRPSHIGAIVVHPKYRRQGIGTELLNMAVNGLMPAKGARVSAGQDYLHFFPGVPENCLAAEAFFTANGWDIIDAGACWDLFRKLGDYATPPAVAAKIKELESQGIVIRPCGPADTEALFAHVAANFSERWLSETRARVALEAFPAEIIVAARGSEIVGFCHTYSTTSTKIGPSIYWRSLQGTKYGGLGPIGVAKDVRKIGLGLALLCRSVEAVKASGATQMVIDWTVLVDFYGRIGFQPWKRYVPVSRVF